MKKFILILLLTVCGNSFAVDFLSGEFWALFELPTDDFHIVTPDQEELIELLQDEMRFIYSGIIYGFSFTYVPSDVSRSIEEVLKVELMAEIAPGDKNLSVYQSRMDNSRMYVRSKYTLEEYQQRWYDFWDSSAFPVSQGEGVAEMYLGYDQRIEACRQGIKEAVRNYLRQRYYNKPQEISGYVRLTDIPFFRVDAGGFVAKVRVTMDIREIKDYQTF